MKSREKKDLPQERDRHLDVPAEANRDKHINFVEIEEQENRGERNYSDSRHYIPPNSPHPDGNSEGGNRA